MRSPTIEAWLEARQNLGLLSKAPPPAQLLEARAQPRLSNGTLVITFNEVCHHHGTGILLWRLFGAQPNVIHLRSQSHYSYNQLGEVQIQLKPGPLRPGLLHSQLLARLQVHQIERMVCVPFDGWDLQLALAAHDLWKVTFCLYLMDDQNIHSPSIPDSLMAEALERADLVLTIGPEMRDAYESKYGTKC